MTARTTRDGDQHQRDPLNAQLRTLKALTIHQPWAWATINAGKDVENRRWKTTYRGRF
jgi:hypothetical protein